MENGKPRIIERELKDKVEEEQMTERACITEGEAQRGESFCSNPLI